MSTRTIKLKLLTQTSLVKVETSARTFAEFKNEPTVMELGIDWNSAKLIDRATKATFDLDESVLPSVDSLMFVTPTKTKSGIYTYQEARQKVKEYKDNGGNVPFNYTHSSTAQLNTFLSSVEAVIAAQQSLEEVSKSIGDEEFIPVDDLADFVTKDELDAEAEALKGRI